MLLTRLYLRASTDEQDATRAQVRLESFAAEHGLTIVATYVENMSGASLARPELFRLLKDARAGDVMLIEQIDRLTRLSDGDWKKLRREIEDRQVRVVSLDLPTSWTMTVPADEFTGRLFASLNAMMLDLLAAMSRKDYADRRRRQAEGIAARKAKDDGGYIGRPEDVARNAAIANMLRRGLPWTVVRKMTGASKFTVAKIAARNREEDALPPVRRKHRAKVAA